MLNKNEIATISQKELYEKIYQLVKKRNNKVLERLATKVSFISTSPIYRHDLYVRLAREEDNKSLRFLFKKLSLRIDDVACFYAFVDNLVQANAWCSKGMTPDGLVCFHAILGDFKKVNGLISKGANINDAIYGYALKGREKLVNELLLEGDYINALMGYLNGGHSDQAKELFRSCPKNLLSDAIYYFALYDKFEDIVSMFPRNKHFYDFVMTGYEERGLLNPKDMLPLLYKTDNKKLTQLLMKKLEKSFINKDLTLIKIKKLGQLKQHDLNFEQAETYLSSQKAWGWLFQGTMFVRNGVLPPEIYIHILSFLLKSSTQDTIEISRVAGERTREREVLKPSFFSCFFPKKAKVKRLEEGHQEKPKV